MRARAPASLLTVCALMGAAPSAFASPSDSDHTAAVESFRRGTQLVEAGKLQDAVDAFRDALQREPTSVGARLDLADCYEKIGTPASAWREYVIAAEYARRAGDAREALARSSAAGLESRLVVVKLVFVGPPAPAHAREMHLDGESVAEEIVARASFAVAPGRHRVEITEAGKKPVSLEIAGAAGETRALRVAFESATAPPDAVSAPPLTAPQPSQTSPSSSQRTWGFVLGGLGVVGAGVGAACGFLAISKRSTLESESHDASVGASRFYSDRSSADTVAGVSTVGLIAGGVALAAGVVLVVTAPGKRQAGWIRVGPGVGGGSGVVAGGAF